jgi:hypothetical protein
MKKKLVESKLTDFILQLKEVVEGIQSECDAQEALIKKLENENKQMHQILQSHETEIRNLDIKIKEVLDLV